MKVPFHLRRTTARPATALLLLTDSAQELLALCVRIGGPQLPVIHAVAGGFVVRLGQQSDQVYPQTIRLRSLACNLLVPVDADLVPALHGDEAEALVRQRGLVFLPDGKVLSFSPEVVLSASDLLSVSLLPGRPWQPLPPRPERPDRLHEVLLEADPLVTVEGLLETGGSGIGVEAPRPAEAGPATTAAAHGLAGLGRGLAWLGRQLGIESLAQLGRNLVEQAIRQAPRISEAVLGAQEAALRELLRQFREGDVEQALRHALPLGDSEGRGAQTASNADLPTHNLFYNLASLLGGARGPGSVWLASGDVYESLASEYRKAAELATQRGDYRRAAFIYGRLLHDWRLAAAVLERGGLHHDAAILYLEKLADQLAAARAFEAAGEVDQALRLYLARCEHVSAGDLLKRAGEPELALKQYELAAYLEAGRNNHQEAGDILLNRAGRPDRAEPYFRAGWQQRPAGTFHACLLRLFHLYAGRLPPTDLLALVDEADHFFASEGSDQQAAAFYNDLARVSPSDPLHGQGATLLDRALRGLAGRLRQRADLGQHGPSVASSLFLPLGRWEPALVHDAEVALRGAARERPTRAGQPQRIPTHAGRLTAVCAARLTGQVFLGFEDGAVVRFDPRQGSARLNMGPLGRIDTLAVDDEARLLVAVSHEKGPYLLASHCAETSRALVRPFGEAEMLGPPGLTPVAASNGRYAVGLWDGQSLHYLTGVDLVPEARLAAPVDLRMALMLSVPTSERPRLLSLLFEPDFVSFQVGVVPGPGEERMRLRMPWGVGEALAVEALPLSWLPLRGRYLEIAGVTDSGALGWALLRLFGSDAEVLGNHQTSSELLYRAVALVRPGVVAGVQARGVMRFFADEIRLQARPMIRADLSDAVACFYSAPTSELLVIADQGDVVRVPLAE
jgi:tetratricopeptide (TPR) repeat protein